MRQGKLPNAATPYERRRLNMTYCNGSGFGEPSEAGTHIDSDTRKEILELLSRSHRIAREEHLDMIEYLISLVILEVRDTPELHRTDGASSEA